MTSPSKITTGPRDICAHTNRFRQDSVNCVDGRGMQIEHEEAVCFEKKTAKRKSSG